MVTYIKPQKPTKMEKEYFCPSCSGYLKITDCIILLGKNQKKEHGFIILHPEVGNYTSRRHPSFKLEPYEAIELFCPLCHASLASDFDDNLSHLILQEKGKNFDIYFSKILGEESTYLVNGGKVTATGQHSDRYTYFKMSDKFKQYLKK
ncbi:MAG TPA: hypothetical protein DDX98_07620 [Bacteroidales bacterium]|nr:hypothetical protein [Bacteroidales bacterium]